MALADARAMHPPLLVAEADERAEAELLAVITDWCRRFTPLAALDPPRGVMLDIAGAAHLFGGEVKVLDEIEGRLAAQGFSARAAIADTPEAAWALARFSDARIAPAGADAKTRALLFDRLPLAALRLDADMIDGLAQAGLRRIGDIALRPRAPIAARFGSDVFARHDALKGMAKSAISPRFEAPAYLVERRFAEGIARREDVEGTIFALAKDLSGLLERHGEGARRLEVALFRVDGVVKRIAVGTSRPLREPQAMGRLFRERIAAVEEAGGEEGLDAGYGFDVVRLAALAVEPAATPQASLAMHNADSAMTGDLADLIDRLGARLGIRRVTRLVANDTHIPEFAVVAVAAAGWQSAVGNRQSKTTAHCPLPTAASPPDRPIRLLQRPEAIEAIAAVPDGPPVKFRWRRVLHEVAAVEGPERIAPEWWKAQAPALTRDYFRAEDTQGQRFWLYREGFYARETETARWYMHGLFG